jgi:hypothetical protein
LSPAAGTADLPVAEEAVVTLETLGSRVVRLYDVGVAGLHRCSISATFATERGAIIVVAGMEGALASVVGGLVGVPSSPARPAWATAAAFRRLGPAAHHAELVRHGRCRSQH